MTGYIQARENMVSGQLLPHKVFLKSILKIMATVPREDFVPRTLTHLCYADEALEVFKNRYLLSPMVFARLVQEANIGKEEKILDIGFGTGYSSLLFGFLCREVIGLESDKSLVARLRNTLSDYGVMNVHPVYGSLEKGWAEEAPYDIVFIEGAVQDIPVTIMDQVKENGRIVAMKGQMSSNLPQALIMTKSADGWTKWCPFEAATPYLKEFVAGERFIL